MSTQEKPGFQVTINDASVTTVIDETPPKETATTQKEKGGVKNAAADQA